MWPLTVMEITFGSAMLVLVADIFLRRRSLARRLAPPVVVMTAIVASLAAIALDWASSLGGEVLQPSPESVASIYMVDRFSTLVAITVLTVGLAACVYSMSYFDSDDRPAPFYALLSTTLCSLIGVISAGDYLVLFLFWEGMSVSAYGLVSFSRGDISMEASLKYFFLAGVGSLIALFGIGLVYSAAGTIQLSAAVMAVSASSTLGELGLVLLIIGLGVEAAIVPLHTWLPDVYSAAPLPVASIVSGAVTGTGVFALLKVLEPLIPLTSLALGAAQSGAIQNLQLLLAFLALVTMTVGNLSALAQGNLRRILSFSSVAQTGYMLAALSTLSVAGLVAVVFTIWNHGILKSGFFMLIGRRNSTLQGSSLDALKGLGRADRPFGLLLGASSLAMMGSPPFGMFWSEILVVQSLVLSSGPAFLLLAGAVVLNIVLSIGYYFRVINTVVFGQAEGELPVARGASLIPSASLVALSLVTGVAPFLILGRVL